MEIFKKIGKMLSGPPSQTERVLNLYVQCDKCGEKLKVRVDIWNELSPEYEGDGEAPTSYYCRKVLIGEKRCYQPIELKLRFDRNHRLVEREVGGGKIIEEAESDG